MSIKINKDLETLSQCLIDNQVTFNLKKINRWSFIIKI